MEFLGTFGCIWSSKEVKYVIIGRAEQGSEVPQRRHEVAPKHLSERPSWSDPVKSLAIFIPLEAQSDAHRSLASHTPLRATSQSDTPRSLASLWRDDTKRSLERPLRATHWGRSRRPERLVGATCRGRSASIICSISILLKVLLVISLCTFYISKTYVLNIFGSHRGR